MTNYYKGILLIVYIKLKGIFLLLTGVVLVFLTNIIAKK